VQALGVEAQALLVALVVFPGDVAWEGVRDEHGPFFLRERVDDDFVGLAREMGAVQLVVGVGAGIGGVFEGEVDGGHGRAFPFDIFIPRTAPAAGEQQALVAEEAQDFMCAAQAGDIGDEDDADLTEADGGDQGLEAFAAGSSDRRLAQIIVNHCDPLRAPAQGLSAVGQVVLQVLALEVGFHLVRGGLADLDIGAALEVLGGDLTAEAHRAPPAGRGFPGLCAKPLTIH